jgi:hypothetical protein
MTNVLIFGQEAAEPKQLKKIELVKCLSSNITIANSGMLPHEFKNLMLFEKNYGESGFDIIFGWDNINDKTIFLGHWNDGVV